MQFGKSRKFMTQITVTVSLKGTTFARYCCVLTGSTDGFYEEALQSLHRLEKYLNLEGFLEKSLKIKSALKSTGKSLKSLEKSLNSTIFCRT